MRSLVPVSLVADVQVDTALQLIGLQQFPHEARLVQATLQKEATEVRQRRLRQRTAAIVIAPTWRVGG